MIIGMDRCLAAEFTTKHFDRPVRDHLVDIHVGLGSRAGLPHRQREMRIELSFRHLARRLADRLAKLGLQPTERHVGLGRRMLDDAERPDDGLWLLFPADLEIAERALRLRSPIAVMRHLDMAEGVAFFTRLGHCRSFHQKALVQARLPEPSTSTTRNHGLLLRNSQPSSSRARSSTVSVTARPCRVTARELPQTAATMSTGDDTMVSSPPDSDIARISGPWLA